MIWRQKDEKYVEFTCDTKWHPTLKKSNTGLWTDFLCKIKQTCRSCFWAMVLYGCGLCYQCFSRTYYILHSKRVSWLGKNGHWYKEGQTRTESLSKTVRTAGPEKGGNRDCFLNGDGRCVRGRKVDVRGWNKIQQKSN